MIGYALTTTTTKRHKEKYSVLLLLTYSFMKNLEDIRKMHEKEKKIISTIEQRSI